MFATDPVATRSLFTDSLHVLCNILPSFLLDIINVINFTCNL